MDYYGYPHVKTYLQPLFFVVDVPNKAAAIPGTGDEVLAFTYTQDVAKFTVASLSLPKWDEVTYIYGERSTFNKLLALAEEARGTLISRPSDASEHLVTADRIAGTKFDVTYDSVEKLAKGEITELPSHHEIYPVFPKAMLQGLFALFSLWIVEGRLDVPEEKSLNAKFPQIKTTKLSEIVGAWKGH
jgi:hypothetical protein